MSGDETMVLIVALCIAGIGWGRWFYLAGIANRFGATANLATPFYLVPAACWVAIFLVLRLFASHDVRDSATYLFFYMVFSAAWVMVAGKMLPLLGIQPAVDALHRRNPAASAAVFGAMLGITFSFAGANIGDGPGWWVVLFSGALSTGSLLLLWGIVEAFTDLADDITIERDLASGLRHAGFIIACGLILGRAAAGNWVSADATVRDFVKLAWPAALLLIPQVALQRMLRPTVSAPEPSPFASGVIPAAVYIGAAAIALVEAGWW